MSQRIEVSAVILAAGVGSRMDMPTTKQRLNICSKSVIERTVKAFADTEGIDEIVVVVRADELGFAKAELVEYENVKFVLGGASRAESAREGFFAVSPDSEYVIIHDGARCLITPFMIEKVLSEAKKHGSASAGCKVSDTLKLVQDGFIKSTVDRERLYAVQTPQIFRYNIYKEALVNWDKDVTDDNTLLERLDIPVKIVDIGKENIKITTKDDLPYAEYIIKEREKCLTSE